MGFGGLAAGLATGVIGTGLGIYEGNKAASAGRSAAGSSYSALDASKGEALGRLDPYAMYGRQALTPLSALLFGQKYDPNTQSSTPISEEERMSYFKQSPNYQFTLDQGLKAIEKRNAATGSLLSGGLFKELQSYGQQTASGEYNNFISQLFQQAGIGQAADTNAASVIQGIGSQQAGYNYAGGMANAQKYANLSNFMFNLGGQGFSTALNAADGGLGGGGSNNSGGGTYNSAYGQQAGLSALLGGGS